MIFRSKPPYAQEEIGEQIYQIGILVEQNFAKPSPRGSEAILIARETLLFMLESVQEYNQKHDKRASLQRYNKAADIASSDRASSVRKDDEE